MTLQYRFELCNRLRVNGHQWSSWSLIKSSTLACAADPDYGTGRVQEREAPEPNNVTIEPYAEGK